MGQTCLLKFLAIVNYKFAQAFFVRLFLGSFVEVRLGDL